jgi:hypothetical protein
MIKKKYIGEVLSFKFQYVNSIEIYRGYLIDYNDDWTLLKYNANDYVRDGYIILRNKHIISYKQDEEENFHKKVLDLKGESVTQSDKIPMDNIKTILSYLTEKYGVFQFDLRSNTYCYIGKVKSIDKNSLTIDYLDSIGNWSETREYKLGNIRTIQYDSDYINSLLLVSKSNK